MAMKRYNLLILLAALLLCFSLVFAEVYDYEEQQKKDVVDASRAISSGDDGTVKQTQSGSGLGEADFFKKKPCSHCKLFLKRCCGFFCCTEGEYARYMEGEAVLPHN